MRSAAPICFGVIQGLLRDGIILGIQRLLEQGQKQGRQRASLESLVKMTPVVGAEDAAVVRRLKTLRKAMHHGARSVDEWRNRLVAHRDLPTVLDTHPVPLSAVKIRAARELIDLITKFLVSYGDHFMHESVNLETPDLDADTLIFLLKSARLLDPPPLR